MSDLSVFYSSQHIVVDQASSSVSIIHVGPQGIQGVKGDQGDKGDKGDKGDTGDPGPPNLFGDLIDVTLTTPAENDIVKFNGTIWVNVADTDHAHTNFLKLAEDDGVTALTELTTLTGDEAFYVVEDVDGTPLDRKIISKTLSSLEPVSIIAATGSTETLAENFGWYDLTMDQNCEITFPTNTAGRSFVLILRGAYTPTLPGSILWVGGDTPSYTSPSLYSFFGDGTNWFGVQVGWGFA